MMKNWLPLAIILTFCILAGWFATLTPYRTGGYLFNQSRMPTNEIGAPDERQHANYVKHLLTEGTIPVLKPGTPDFGETYQSHQPPLYYMLAAGWAKASGADPAEQSGKRIRYLNALFGAVTLLGVFYAARWGLGRDDIGVAAMAFVGFNPMFVSLNAAITNDALLYALCTWGFALSLKVADGSGPKRDLLWLAAVCGLATLTKISGIVLLPVAAIAVYLRKTEDRQEKLVNLGLVLGGGLLIAAPWLLRNNSLYGDPLGLKIFTEAFAGSPKASDMAAALGPQTYWVDFFGWWTARSFFGAFGQMDIFFGHQVYRVLFAVAFLLLVGILRTTGSEYAPTRTYRILAWTLALLVLAQYLRFNLMYFQAQSRYLFPAIAVFGIAFAIGLAGWTKAKFAAATLVLVGLLVAGNVATGVYLQGEFPRRISGLK